MAASRQKTRDRAQGRWRSILKELGFTDKELSGNHGPCPGCGGTDRFRFTDYKGGGEYFCRGCDPGGGLDLVMLKFDCDFADAAKMVDNVIGVIPERGEVFQPKVNIEKRRENLNSLWAQGTDDVIVVKYMHERGIDVPFEWLRDLRGNPECYLADVGRVPAMLALIRNSKGRPISIHRTFIGRGIKKIMPPTEKMVGGAIYLGDHAGEVLVVGEGIETTLTGMAHLNVSSGMAAISANNMEQLKIPEMFDIVVILADHDASFTGQKAAFTLGRRLDNEKRDVRIALPHVKGHDMNDLGSVKDCCHWFSNRRKHDAQN